MSCQFTCLRGAAGELCLEGLVSTNGSLELSQVLALLQKKDWLSLVAVHSDTWLLAVAFYNGARLNREGRERLFELINEQPTCYEVVSGRASRDVARPKKRGAPGQPASRPAGLGPPAKNPRPVIFSPDFASNGGSLLLEAALLRSSPGLCGSFQPEAVSAVFCALSLPSPKEIAWRGERGQEAGQRGCSNTLCCTDAPRRSLKTAP